MLTTESAAVAEIIGREQELATVDAFVEPGGPTRALVLAGGPGIGKTPGTPAFRVLFGLAWTPDFSAPKAESESPAARAE